MPDKTTVEEELKYYTAKAGDVARQLAFVGVAIVWLFRYEDAGMTRIPKDLQDPLGWLVLVLALDALQYLVGSVLWSLAVLSNPYAEAYRQRGKVITLLIFVLFKLAALGWAYSTMIGPSWDKVDFFG